MVVHLGVDGALLDDAALGGEVALQDGEPAVARIGVRDGADDLLVEDAGVLRARLLRHERAGHCFAFEEPRLDEGADDGGDAADFVEFFDVIFARGRQAAQIGRRLGDLVHRVDGELLFGKAQLARKR